jgi:hypothetical protein
MGARGSGARVAAVSIAFAAAVGALRAGDQATPKELLQRAKQALAKKKYDEAEDLYAQAAVADPSSIGARYWIGQVREKAGDDVGAIDAYREFRDGARTLESEGRLTADDRDLLKKAGARLAALAPGDAEYAKLRRTFTEEVLGFAEARRRDDPVGATRAIEVLASVDPDDAKALETLEALTRGPDAEAETTWRRALPTALRPIRGWRDLVKLQAFGEDAPPRLAYVAPGLVVERSDGGTIFRRPYPSSASYALAMEFRAKPMAGPKEWSMGFAVWRPDKQEWAFGYMDGAVHVATRLADTKWKSYVIVPTPAAPDAWHRLEVLVRADRVAIWFDGQKKGDTRVPVAGLQGTLGLMQANSRIEVRFARHAVLD